MVALLKQKSKITLQHKPRKVYEVKPIFKRAKLDTSIIDKDREVVNNVLGTSGTGKTTKKVEPTVL